MLPVAVDALGGDNAPDYNIAGAQQALEAGIPVLLVGPADLVGHGNLQLHVASEFIDMHEDDTIHLGDQQGGLVKEQLTMAKKIGVIDRWGKVLTIATVAYGVGIACYYLYVQWVDSGKLPGS